MASRNRPRASQLKDEIDEERSLWTQIQADAKQIDQLMEESDKASSEILELGSRQQARIADGRQPSESIDNRIEALLRENIRITEDINEINITEKIQVLEGLRNSNETETLNTSRANSVGKAQRERPNKRKMTDSAFDDHDSIAADSPAANPIANPSPKVVIAQKDRLMAKSGSSRAGSVPMGRESSVKVEDDKDDFGKDPKHRLHVGTEVLYRNNKSRSLEGEGILCRVTTVIGEGKQRRYEIIDSDPEPPTPALPYRASVNHLVAIPSPSITNISLPDLPRGRNVLAMYPGTTTFYKAEVVRGWVGRREGTKEGGADEGMVRLKFEGEDETDREMNVERRYVLPDK
ncbi:hypothetical protein K504DRAFT_466432 [Pleomassaria siparia CBS 279.74]|uniref:SGF29 C-terminal domain-containing protein n=1 Tax=Pleomassaria siparia CBS 279.74 TaxID=1314801 RepID=A0A6G1KAY8_9PLEO|nr:hypothetical protein K504DRAFT_466432 [Pleomassaria siparia CBS 279.74]